MSSPGRPKSEYRSALHEGTATSSPGCPFAPTQADPACATYRRPFGRPHAPAVRREIESLDAQHDCQRIVHLLYAYEFPFDLLRSTEVALFHTYGSRAVSTLLDRTGEFAQRGQKRYDDTRLLIGQFMECGWSGEAGHRAIAQMNHIHSFYKIANDDFLFVLWTFIDFPIQWMRDYGWRAFTEHECAAWFHYWCEIGQRMGLSNIPADKAAFDAFVRSYEAREFVPCEASHRVASATMNVMAAWLPRPLRGWFAPVSLSLVRPQLLAAIGYEAPPRWLKAAVHGVLKLRGWAKRFVSLERHPMLLAHSLNRSYPGNRYRTEALGPEHARREG
jgi:hypothetical protein